jgi:hypothetical protein
MTEFKPTISERETKELIQIAHSSTEHWQQEVISQAKKELIKRNVTEREQNEIIENLNKEAEKYFKKEAERLKKNKTESYTSLEMILIFIFGPLKFFRRYDDVFTLRKDNYFLKFKQRIIILTLGFISWFIFIYVSYNIYEEKRLQEIEKIDISDWKNEHGYD